MTTLVSPVGMGLYGVTRCGFDFVSVLIVAHWISVPTEPALWTCWQVADEATTMKRAASIKQYCVDELRQRRIVFERVGKTLDSRPWTGNGPQSRETRCKRSSTR